MFNLKPGPDRLVQLVGPSTNSSSSTDWTKKRYYIITDFIIEHCTVRLGRSNRWPCKNRSQVNWYCRVIIYLKITNTNAELRVIWNGRVHLQSPIPFSHFQVTRDSMEKKKSLVHSRLHSYAIQLEIVHWSVLKLGRMVPGKLLALTPILFLFKLEKALPSCQKCS